MNKVLTFRCLAVLFSLIICCSCYTKRSKVNIGNGCPESQPWPCKTPGRCLSFDFICDGEADCPDKYDEDPALCIAKDRPPAILLEMFIHKWNKWLVPNILGSKDIETLSVELIESKTIDDYAKAVGLNKEQLENLKSVMEAVKNGRQIDLLLMGMPERAWNEIYVLFNRIVKSGFLGSGDYN